MHYIWIKFLEEFPQLEWRIMGDTTLKTNDFSQINSFSSIDIDTITVFIFPIFF